jgi:hypothetical protein
MNDEQWTVNDEKRLEYWNSGIMRKENKFVGKGSAHRLAVIMIKCVIEWKINR